VFPIRTHLFPAQLILLYSIIRILFSNNYKFCSSHYVSCTSLLLLPPS
jgi:hypothetical protein